MFPVVLGVLFMVQLGGSIANPIFSLFVSELNGPANAATVSGVVIACTAALSAVSAVVVGRYSDRIGRTKVLLVCLSGACIAYLPQAFVQTIWQLLGLRLLLGLCLGGLIPTANALVAELVPAERRGVAFGLSTGTTSMASAVGPMTGAGITATWGIRALFLVTGTLFALAFTWVGLMFRRAGDQALSRPSVALAELSTETKHPLPLRKGEG
jgi:DHA1 family multidrug resistance protein-like MFS transporter